MPGLSKGQGGLYEGMREVAVLLSLWPQAWPSP